MSVSFLYFGKAPQLNGAAIFFTSLVDNKDVFENSLGEHIRFFYQRTINNSTYSTIATNKKKDAIKNILNSVLPKTLIGSIIFVYIYFQRNAVKVVKSYLKERQIDNSEILIFNDIFVGMECLKHKRIDLSKSILILHNDGNPLGMLMERLPKLKSYKKFKNNANYLINTVSRIVFLSEKAKMNFINLFPNLKNKGVVINNGVNLKGTNNTSPFAIPHDKLFGISVGTVCRRKGHDLLISAMQKLSIEEAEKIIIFCLGEIDTDVDLSDCPKNLIFLKGINHEALSSYFINSDFFLLCSRNEGLPLSILEAMQYGLPIFSTNVGGIPNIINSNGILFAPTEDNIKQVLQNIINGRYNLAEFSDWSKKLYKKYYSLEVMITKYISIIKEVEHEQ